MAVVARWPNPAVEPIYDLHARWLEVLSTGDSLFTPSRAIWRLSYLDELERGFVGRPDVSKNKSFLEKLRDQLADLSPTAIQLMAEIHAVHFLIIWNGAISAAKKISDMETIVSWMPVPVEIRNHVKDVMSPGIVHPGQWVMTRRDVQLTWLIRFARAWTGLDAAEQQSLIGDPWAMKAFAEQTPAEGADAARLALLHLAHPDTFEAVVSVGHRKLLIDRFGELASADADTDRQLLEVRSKLKPEFGETFNWYDDPLVHLWLKPKAWKTLLGWMEKVRADPDFDELERAYKLPIAADLASSRKLVLSREDGWLDSLRKAISNRQNNLTQWQSHSRFLNWLAENEEDGRQALLALWEGSDGPADRFARFVDLVPASVLGTLGARINIGAFLLMAEDVRLRPPIKIESFRQAWKLAGWGADAAELSADAVYRRILMFLDELVRAAKDWAIPFRDPLDAQSAIWSLVRNSDQPPGWSDELWQELLDYRSTVPSVEDLDDQPPEDAAVEAETEVLVDHIAAAATDLHVPREALDEIVGLLDDKGQVVLYGPPGTGKTYVAKRLARALVQNDPDRWSLVQFHPATSYEDFVEGLRPRLTDTGQVMYERTPGPLVELAERAHKDPDRLHVMVIDEINRANLPKVLGELLFLLEYRNEVARTLYRPTEPFALPTNLRFIGTMNTADRSVALIDAAMRRRFHFVPFFPHDGVMKDLLREWLRVHGGPSGVAELLDAVNLELGAHLGDHLLVGPSHFMKTDLSLRALERIWTYNVYPLIEEHLWGEHAEIARWTWTEVRTRFATSLGRGGEDAR